MGSAPQLGSGTALLRLENYVGERGCRLDALAVSFGGTCSPFGDCAANPPWGWESDAPGSPRGDWFLDPAHVAGFRHLAFLPERDLPGFREYVSNPFLQGDKELVLVAPVAGSEWVIGAEATVEWTHIDVGQGPDLADVVDLDLDRGSGWEALVVGIPIGSGAFTWTVTPPASDSCRVRVSAATDCVLTLSDQSGLFRIQPDAISVPANPSPVARVRPARPNPFATRTIISYELAQAGVVRLRVYDAVGRAVRTLVEREWRTTGPHDAAWDGRITAGTWAVPGVYFYRLEIGGRVAAGRMTLVR